MNEVLELNWEFSWYELAEMEWWELNPTATDSEFESAFYGV